MSSPTFGPAHLLPATSPQALERAAAALAGGAVIAFPTDTVYGLGAHAFLPEAVACLYVVKERPLALAIPLLLPGPEALETVCEPVPDVAWELAERFWPGALSLVLHRATAVPGIVTAGGPTVAVRVPDHDLVRRLGRHLGAPLAATSANRHGHPPLVAAEQVMAALGDRLPLVLDGGLAPGGTPSTVLDLTVSPPAIRRPGPITAADLRPYLGRLVTAY
jgi:L-threonylcarbamoyladenylate synthase